MDGQPENNASAMQPHRPGSGIIYMLFLSYCYQLTRTQSKIQVIVTENVVVNINFYMSQFK